MPIAKFQMPDGRVARFEVAEGTTPEQAQAQIEALIASEGVPEEPAKSDRGIGSRIMEALAGTTSMTATDQGLQPLAEYALEMAQAKDMQTPEIQALQEIGSAPELNAMTGSAFKSSLGLLSSASAPEQKQILSAQFGDKVSFNQDAKGNEIVTLPSGSYALNSPGLSGQDFSRAAFDMAAFTPAGATKGIIAGAAKSGATEGILEAGEYAVGGDFDKASVVAAASIDGVFKGLEKALGAGYRAFKGNVDNDLLAAGADAEIKIMTTDALPPKTFAGTASQQLAEKIPLAGTGGIREQQQNMRAEAVEKIAEKYGQFSHDAIIESIKAQKNKVRSAAGNVLEKSGVKLDAIGVIDHPNTSEAISNVMLELNKPGVIKKNSASGELSVLIEALEEAPQSYTTLKENRTAFRDIVKAADGQDRSQLTGRAKSLLQRVESAMKSDMDAFAKANLTANEFSKLQRANSIWAEESTKLTKSRLKNVLDKGDVTPESVETLLFSSKPSEVKNLYTSLTVDGRKNARAAIISRVVDTLTKRKSGLTPNSFYREMKKMGMQSDVFFKGEEKKALNGLMKVLGSTTRAQDAAVATSTGQSLIGIFTGAGLVTHLAPTIAGGGTVGGLARLYESAPVRDALLRLDSAQVGSSAYEKALREATGIVSTYAQTLREEAAAEEAQ